jgi:hypothetical protein
MVQTTLRRLVVVGSLLAFAACAADSSIHHAEVLFPRAIVGKEDVADAIKFEKELAQHYEVPPPNGQPWFAIIEGDAPIIISAPHATAQIREGQVKIADAGTGSLAVALNKLCSATVIYTTFLSPSDPNYYDTNEYKIELARLIDSKKPTLVLDLHASDPMRPYDVDFGTMGGTSLLSSPQLLVALADGLRVAA